MQVYFGYAGSDLQVKVDTDLNVERPVLCATWHCGSALPAAALQVYLAELFEQEIARIREEAYSLGWKDAKARNRKKREFSGYMDAARIAW